MFRRALLFIFFFVFVSKAQVIYRKSRYDSKSFGVFSDFFDPPGLDLGVVDNDELARGNQPLKASAENAEFGIYRFAKAFPAYLDFKQSSGSW
jgi:hypothetical protein